MADRYASTRQLHVCVVVSLTVGKSVDLINCFGGSSPVVEEA